MQEGLDGLREPPNLPEPKQFLPHCSVEGYKGLLSPGLQLRGYQCRDLHFLSTAGVEMASTYP